MEPVLFRSNSGDQSSFYDDPVNAKEHLGRPTDPLALEIDDEELVKILDKKIETDKKFWTNKYNLTTRRKKMEMALFGKQITELEKNNQLKKYETRYSNNALYEIEASLKPVAMSKLPDMIVTPGNETPESKQVADDVSKAINDDLKKRESREVLGLAFKHLPVYLTAIIKVRWNPELGEHGDIEFVNVHPDRVVIDSTATSKGQAHMRTIPELIRLTVQDLVMRFPNKRKALFEKLHQQGLVVGEGDFAQQDMATELDIWEVWFTWYKNAKGDVLDSPSEVEISAKKYEKIEGVLWKYDDVILAKMRNPNFDYEGEERWFVYDDPSMEQTKRPVNPDEMIQMAMMGQSGDNIQPEHFYFNYFKEPQKPYFFFGYDQWGKVAIDETSRIEQNIYNQENLNGLGKQILDTIKTRVKNVWSTEAGLKANDIQNMDMQNPTIQLLVDGNVNDVHKAIEPERPDAAQFNALSSAKETMFALAGATNLTGVIQSDVATTNQIAREQNFTRVDDLVEDTINAASEWMAGWRMQLIKLRYTEEHFKKLLGTKGDVTFIKLKRDSIDDGMEVMIKASSSDKAKAQKNAMDAAQLGAPFINPIDFFKDMEYSDPEGRTERGMLFATDPQAYLVKYGMGLQTTEQQAAALAQQPLPQPPVPGVPPTGQPAPQPQQPSPMDTANAPVAPPTTIPGSLNGGAV